MMNRRNWTSVVVVVVLVAAAAGLLVPMRDAGTVAIAQSGGEPAEVESAGRPVRVVVQAPARRPLAQVVQLPASLEPGELADLFAKTSGYVSAVHVDIGSRVSAGDVLLEIDVPEMDDDLKRAEALLAAQRARLNALRAKATQAESMIAIARAQVRRREAQRSLAAVTVRRQGQLFAEKAIPEQDLDQAKSRLAVMEAEVAIALAKVRSAEAQKVALDADVAVARSNIAVEEADLARLRTMMAYAAIRAPFDGVVTERFVDAGAFVRSAAEGTSKPMLTVARVDRLRLVLNIPERDAVHVRVGTEIEASFGAGESSPLRVAVARTAMALRENTRTMRVEADIDNGDGRLMPGLYARASVLLQSSEQAMMIPSKALRVRGSEISVLVADGAVARSRSITLGYDDGIWAEVKGGLSENERVIVSASGALAPGAPVAPSGTGL